MSDAVPPEAELPQPKPPEPKLAQPKPPEPKPPEADDVPAHVLDELKLVFGGGGPTGAAAGESPTKSTRRFRRSKGAKPAPAPTDSTGTGTGPAVPVPVPVPVPVRVPAGISLPDPSFTVTGAGSTAATEPVRARNTIVIGGDDSLPDPVYLDDPNLDPVARTDDDSGGRATIVIGDDLDLSGAFDAVAVPSRSMDPRVRARRVAVKRAKSRKRLLWVGLAVLVVLIGVAVLAVFSSSLFAVDRIDVQGADYTQVFDAAQLQAVLDDLQGEPVLLVDTRAAEQALEQIPWIERAFVTTDFPHRVLVDVRERRPLATFAGSDGRYRVIDRDGRVLTVLAGRPVDYMLLTGPAPDVEAGGLAGAPFAAAAQMVSALPAEIRSLTVSASVDATTGDLGLSLMRPAPAADDPSAPTTTAPPGVDEPGAGDLIEVRIGSSANLDSKLARLLQQVRDGLDGVRRIDVSTDPMSVR